jgi:hypothetical protein
MVWGVNSLPGENVAPVKWTTVSESRNAPGENVSLVRVEILQGNDEHESEPVAV